MWIGGESSDGCVVVCLDETRQEELVPFYRGPTHKQLVHAGLALLQVDPLDGNALLTGDTQGSLHHSRSPTS